MIEFVVNKAGTVAHQPTCRCGRMDPTGDYAYERISATTIRKMRALMAARRIWPCHCLGSRSDWSAVILACLCGMSAPIYWHDERQWTLGQLIDALVAMPQDALVRFDSLRAKLNDHGEPGLYPGRFVSHRGDYSHLSLERAQTAPTVGTLNEQARAALGRTFEGWKGGTYRMYRETPVWAENYGNCAHIAIVGVNRSRSGEVVIKTAVIEP